MRHTALLLAALLAACAQAPAPRPSPPAPASLQASPAGTWLADVRAIADAADNAGRRAALARRLDALGLDWRAVPFQAGELRGENLLAELGGPDGAPLLLLGAHYDRVEVGQGATDNASGSAVVLALAQRLRERPLRRHRVAIAFWDLEERGLLGAKAYVAAGTVRPALYVNFDVFGWGDTLWLRPPAPDHALARAGAEAAAGLGLDFSAGAEYPPSDHLPFLKAGWSAASFSLVGAGEVEKILAAYAGRKPAEPAKAMQVLHSARDTLAEIDPEAAARGVEAVERALRQWDAAAP
ncbi:M28 family metallopeptidase [Vulcaniibacterium tengchongense]|uniref:Peptidase M28-like protein n=1 Tax=Vulcaniibacterium tengchongense TaxID=1273429 RepID=A0A3N4W6N2_9GAMM|nr:M28 family peptidase [Vulcaniibacterium tengchongense]RPE81740.1 peptidase M28-like protein [Vulcaniibacterium tengchongense]